MRGDFFTEAIVLDKKSLGESDSRVFLYTKHFGKVVAKVKSARKITSKLSAHLEPMNLVDVRLIFLKDFQAVDALKRGRLNYADFLQIFNLINQTAMENQPDDNLWRILRNQYVKPQRVSSLGIEILKILGFDSRFAACHNCKSANPTNFSFADAHYLCSSCLIHYNYSNNDVFSI